MRISVNITLKEQELKIIDDKAREQRRTRSNFFTVSALEKAERDK